MNTKKLCIIALVSSVCLSPMTMLAQTGPAPGDDDVMGLHDYRSYHGGDIDRVDLSTGSLFAHTQLLSYPQRGRLLKESFSIYYNSHPYHTVLRCPDTGCEIDWVASTNGVGAFLADDQDALAGYNQTKIGQGYYCYFSIITPDKAKHALEHVTGSDNCTNGLTSAEYESIDTTAYHLSMSVNGSGQSQTINTTVTDSAGVRYYSISPGQQPTVWKEDPNGNQILRSAFNGAGLATAIVDTLGRTIPVPTQTTASDSSGCPQGGTLLPVSSAKVWSPPGYAGGTLSLKYCYASVWINLPGDDSTGLVPFSRYVGMLQSVVLPNGTAWSFEYQDVDSSGYSWGNLTKITFPTGGTISYVYNVGATGFARYVSSRTVNANDGTGNHAWTYTGVVGGIVRVHDPLGNDTDHTFTSLGASSSFETKTQYYQGAQPSHQLLKTVDTVYSSNQSLSFGNMAVNVVPTSITTTWPSGKVSKATKTYDTAITNNGVYVGTYGKVLTDSEYDYGTGAAGSLIRTTTNNYQFLANSNYKTNNILDPVQSVKTQDGSGNQVAYSFYNYDEGSLNSSGVTLQHDSAPPDGVYRGNQTSVHRWLNTGTLTCPGGGSGGSNSYVISNVTYFDTGKVSAATDPCGNATSYLYSSTYAGAFPTTVTNALNQATTNVFDFNTGLLTSTTDPNNQTTSITYDSMLRPAQINHSDGGLDTITHQEATFPFSATLTTKINSTLNKVQTNVFDGLGRVSQTQLTSDSPSTTYTLTTYDALGRTSQVYNPTRCSPITTNCGESTWGYTTTQYDALSRVTSVTEQDGSTASTNYSGFPCTTVTDEAGRSRKSCVDGVGRLLQVFEDPSNLNYETDYTYSALNDLLTVNQKGNDSNSSHWRPRTFTYDSLSRLLTANNPESGTINYAYDPIGNLSSKITPQANQTGNATTTTSYCYDPLNRVLGKAYAAQSCPLPSPVATYGYDGIAATSCTPPTLTDSYPKGHNTSMCDASGTTAWSHDPMGRVLTERRTINGNSAITQNLSYTYNVDGSVATLIYPSSRMITYTPSAAGRNLSAVDVANSVNYITGATYAPPGELTGFFSVAAGSTVSGALSYNSRLQPMQLYYTTGTIASGTITQLQTLACPTTTASIMSRAYIFGAGTNDNGNVQDIVNCRDGNRTQNFTYDALNRIATAYTTGPNWGETFTIDPWGNLTNRSGVTGKTNYEPLNVSVSPAANNQLTGFGYDAAGNMTLNGVSYTYDAENRLSNTAGVTYTYDGDGQRVKKSSGTLYWGGTSSDALAETDLSGNLLEEYIYFNGKRVARREPAGDVRYYFSDHLGSASVIANSTGTIRSESDYYPYGGEIVITSGDTNHYKFTGKERDSESGLDNFGARYDSSALGRFMTPDWAAKPTTVPYAKFGDPQSLNLYSYVENGPVNRMDPDGHECGSDGCDDVKVTVDKPTPSVQANVASADGPVSGIGVQTTITITDKNDKAMPDVTVNEHPKTTDNLTGKTTNSPAGVAATNSKGAIKDNVIAPMTNAPINTEKQKAQLAKDSLDFPDYNKTTSQTLTFTTPGGAACQASFSETLSNVDSNGDSNPVNSNGVNFTFTHTDPVVSQQPSN